MRKTMRKHNWTVGEVYKKPHYDNFKNLNIHDPNNKLEWAEEPKLPVWVRPLQIFGLTTTVVASVLFVWALASLMLILEG